MADNISNISEIIITFYKDSEPFSHTFSERERIEEIAKNIQCTKITRIERFPNHTNSMQNDSHYYIEIVYRNGKTDEIKFSENKRIIFRFLNTKGPSGDRGYVKGENDTLYEFIRKTRERQGDGSIVLTS